MRLPQRSFGRLSLIAATVGMLLCSLGVSASEPQAATLMMPGSSEVRIDAALRLPRWEKLVPQLITDEQALQRCRVHGRCADAFVEVLSAFVEEHENRSEIDKIRAVNAFFNGRPYVPDAARFGVHDVWQSPISFVSGGGGDCEDYAIAKYVMLRQLGFADEGLRIVVGIDEVRNNVHAVVAVLLQDADEFVVLDNLKEDVGHAARLQGFDPKYAVTIEGRWVYVSAGNSGPRPPMTLGAR